MYHYVGVREAGPDGGPRGLSAAAFEQQVVELLERFAQVPWEAYRWRRHGGSGFPGPSVMFTFDDGLRCQAEVAAPVLENHGARGVFFVPGAVLHRRGLLDAHKIHLLLSHLGDGRLTDAIDGALSKLDPSTDWPTRVNGHRAAEIYHYESPERARLKYLLTRVLPREMRARLLGQLFAEYVGREQQWADRWYASPETWSALEARGHMIGGHGYAHEPLSRLSLAEQEEDLRASRAALAQVLGPGCRPMSYPYGSYQAATAVLSRKAGFEAAMTTLQGYNQSATDPHQLRRVDTIFVDRFVRDARPRNDEAVVQHT